ncbi:hypothetical protein B0O99DRAFT_646207 [Bisporella sp. PMI_857]|nr:hypothetical protein B0O99DRAFT_646207 [Bisporella sp. PMI_857]
MKYDKIETIEDHELHEEVNEGFLHCEETSSPPTTQLSRPLLWFLAAEHALIAFVFIISWNTFVPPSTNLQYQVLTADNKSYPSGQLSWSQNFEALPCGKTPEEAKARGCRFDMLATAWLPPRCIDYELVDEFMELGHWQFYTEMHGTTKHSSYEPELLGSISEPRSIWTSRSWHLIHCLYMWKKIGRALVKGTHVDSETVSEPHTTHCLKSIEEVVFGTHRDPNEIDDFLEIIYPPC